MNRIAYTLYIVLSLSSIVLFPFCQVSIISSLFARRLAVAATAAAAAFGLFFFFFLSRILFTLTFTASHTLGRMTFITKGCPTTKVFTTLAPLDLHTTAANDPNMNIAQSTQALVLGGNKGDLRVGFGSGTTGTLFGFNGGRRRTGGPAHDTTSMIFRQGEGWKVHEGNKLGHGRIFFGFNVTVIKRGKNITWGEYNNHETFAWN